MKYIFLLIFLLNSLYGAVWSRTAMEIATGAITPFVSARMSVVTSQVQGLNSLYDSSVKVSNEEKAKLLFDIKRLEGEILGAIKEINFNQKRLNEIDSLKGRF